MQESKSSTTGNGRREKTRIHVEFPITLRYKSVGGNYLTAAGITTACHDEGIACKLTTSIPTNIPYAYIEIPINGHACELSGRIIWLKDGGNQCGIKFDRSNEEWRQFVASSLQN